MKKENKIVNQKLKSARQKKFPEKNFLENSLKTNKAIANKLSNDVSLQNSVLQHSEIKNCNKNQNKLRRHNFSLANRFSSLLTVAGKKGLGFKILFKSLAISRRADAFSETKPTFNVDLSNSQFRKKNTQSGEIKTNNKTKALKLRKASLGNATRERGNQTRKMASICQKAVMNVKPILELRKVKKGRVTHQVPFALSKRRQEGASIRWLIENTTRALQTRTLQDAAASSNILHQLQLQDLKQTLDLQNLKRVQQLSSRVVDSLRNTGQSVEKRNQIHKHSLNNRAYVQYRWW